MDEKTLRFLRLMREQIRGTNLRVVYSSDAAVELEMAAGSEGHAEYEARLSDLERAGYWRPHPNRTANSQGVRGVNDKGIARADEE